MSLQTRIHYAIAYFLICTLVGLSLPATAVDVVIPQLGSTSSSLITEKQEYELGQQVLKMYRARLPTSSDPAVYEYLEKLITDLAQYSELKEKSFDLLVIENPSMNAFAVPGRVIGVHTGLFLATESEDQLASVLTHELAHVSQRHYARRLEAQKNASLPTMAGVLAGIILAATGSGDMGMAALSASQAAAIDSQLRFSRQFEQEADRLGIQTLAASGRDPAAAGDMFENMLRATRYMQKPPDFLLTHPVTESRITDARARAMRFPQHEAADSLDFFLISARVRLHSSATPQEAVKRFAGEIQGQSLNKEASHYGLALALTDAGDTDAARKELQTLMENRPDKILYQIAMAKVETKDKQYDEAVDRMEALMLRYPYNHTLNVSFAEILMEAGRYEHCELVLKNFALVRPTDDYVWYLLAEVYGMNGKILDVHFARAEYFVLNGVYDKALKQLDQALKLSQGDLIATAATRQRIKEIQDMQEELDNL